MGGLFLWDQCAVAYLRGDCFKKPQRGDALLWLGIRIAKCLLMATNIPKMKIPIK